MLKTADNMKIIMLNDPNLKGCIAHNEFSNLPTLRKSPPWRKIDSPERWREIDDAGLRMYIEKIYGLTGREKINDAFVTTAYASGFDEVKSYLLELPKWDGVERLDTLLIDYLGTDDNKYYRQISRKTLTAAVKRVFEPGCKFDNIMVLSGSQGFGKSTFISKLGQKWFSDNIHEFAGKEASGQLQGYWLLEVGELAGLNKSDVETAKAFISRSVDIYRAPYEKRTVEFPRRCILIGSTNSKSFLRDKSGGRRYWPVEIKEDKAKKSIFTELEGEVEQIWAEALMRYRTGEKVYITEPDVKLLEKYMQSAYTEDNSKEGIIEEFVSRRVPADWSTRGISARRIYWNSEFNADGNEEGLVIRKRVCISEIWCEAFGGDLKDCKRAESNEITQIMENLKGWRKDKNVYKINKDYGSQRTFIREDAE
jgi:predicted P-loop ATPase